MTATASPIPVASDTTSKTSTGDGSQVSVRLTQSLDTLYYSVTGTTTRDIFDSIKANGPDRESETPGRFTSGLTESSASYQSQFIDRRASCEITAVEIELGLVVTLPQHSDPSSLGNLQLSSRWRELAEGVRVHEQAHVDIYIEGVEAFQQRVKALPERFSDCDTLKSSLESAWETEDALTDQKQEAFHESEALLSLELRGPVQRKIDDNELTLVRLREELASASTEIEALRGQIASLDGAMQPYDAQIAAIRAEYPDLELPTATFNEYERLLGEWSNLNDQRNALVAELNALVESHNRTVEELNRVAEETNQMVDEIAWLP